MPRPKLIGPKPPCTVAGCENPRLARGYCGMHWARWKNHGSVDLPQHPTTCTAEECERPVRSKRAGLCEMHYYRLRRTGSLDEPFRVTGECAVQGCSAEATTSGRPLGRDGEFYCRLHYLRLKHRNDPYFEYRGERSHLWTGSDATAGAVHQRVRAARGKAKSWSCTDCARPAAHWSYDHLDPDERHDPEKGPYSVDIDHYFPRCVSCHKRFDMDFIMRRRSAA